MENNKLGIVINTTKANYRTSGFRSIYSFNSEDWATVVRDTGAELKKVTNPKSAPVHLVQFLSDGCCYCIMQLIAGRKDYQSAWLFIHKDINLPKGTLSSVIKKIEEVFSFDVEDKKDELDALFSQTYPTSENPSYPASTGDAYAVRYYGEGTDLMYTDSHVLDDYLYQYDYCSYKSVFLVNKTKEQIVSDAEDLSDSKLKKSVVIDLPKEIDGFKPYSGGSLITHAVRITEGTSVAVRWQRTDYAPIDKKGCTTDELLIEKSEYKRSFRLNLFHVVDKVTKKPLKVTPRFTLQHWVDNNQNPTNVFFKEDDLRKISCSVSLEGYLSYSDLLDLTKPNANGEFVIEMQPEEHIYKCYIPSDIKDNREIEFTINTKYKLHGDEIPGFKFEGRPSETRRNKLTADSKQKSSASAGGTTAKHGDGGKGISGKGKKSVEIEKESHKSENRSKGTSWTNVAFYALIAIAICLIGYVMYTELIQKDEIETTDPGVEEQPRTNWDRTFEYLKNNDTAWGKFAMEQDPELKGVYAMIKDFKFKELKSFIDKHEDLQTIDHWKRLYEIASKYNDKKGTFKAKNDSINIEEYLKTDFASKEDAGSSSAASEVTSDSNPNSEHNSAGKDNETGKPTGDSHHSGNGKNNNASGRGNQDDNS